MNTMFYPNINYLKVCLFDVFLEHSKVEERNGSALDMAVARPPTSNRVYVKVQEISSDTQYNR